MPRSAASSIASEVGAPTPTRIGAPATAAFCTSSNDSRPLTQSDVLVQRQQAVEQRAADDLVHRVVAPDVLAHEQQLAGRREEAGGVQAAGAREGRLAQALGQVGEQRARDVGPGGQRRARGPRPPRARPCRRRRTTTSCRSGARRDVAQQRPCDLDRVAPRGPRCGPALARLVDQPLAVEEAERELLVVAGRAHRDRERRRRRRGSPAAPRPRPRRARRRARRAAIRPRGGHVTASASAGVIARLLGRPGARRPRRPCTPGTTC